MLVPLTAALACFVAPLTHVTPPHIAQARPRLIAVPNSGALPLQLRGGGSRQRSAAPSLTAAALPEGYRPESALQPTAFVFVLSVAIVALLPTQHLIATLGAEQATRLLSVVSSVSAMAEILLAPVIGALSDSIGRKPVLLLTLAAVLLLNGVVAFAPSVALIVASRFVCNLVVGLFFLSSGAALGDAYRKNPGQLAAASGVLYALVNAGFAVGIALSRYLPSTFTLRWGYGVSSVAAAASMTIATLRVKESVAREERVPFKLRAFNPLSCVRLLRSGREMRLLAILLAITLQPIFMGDVLQVWAPALPLGVPLGTWPKNIPKSRALPLLPLPALLGRTHPLAPPASLSRVCRAARRSSRSTSGRSAPVRSPPSSP